MKRCTDCQSRSFTNTPSNTSPFHSSASASPAHSTSSSSPVHSVESSSEPSKTTGKIFSDSSSDSGYDESSNPGIGENKNLKSSNTSILKTLKIQQIKMIQLKTAAVSENVRLTNDVVAVKVVPPFVMSSVALPIPPNNPLVDFAIHATRHSVHN